MASRAQWRGYLCLSLVSCPIALYPASSSSETIHFNQIDKNTGHPIRSTRKPPTPVAADTRKERERRGRRRAAPHAQ
jgi:non-homologous end joining protein Ku